MSERIFPGINLSEPDNGKCKFKIIPVASPPNLTTLIQVVSICDLPEYQNIKITEFKPTSWDFKLLMDDFNQVLSDLSHSQGETLTLNGKVIMLVSSEDMKPKTDAERKRLIEMYGTYMLDGGCADHSLQRDGTHKIRVGYAGCEKTISKDRVLEVLAHEFGHTFSSILDHSVYEEIKAYAFQDLFMSHYLNVDRVLDLTSLSPDITHHVAQHKFNQLRDLGIPQGAIIAYITGERFGSFEPDGLFCFIRN